MNKTLILFSVLMSTCACPCNATVKEEAPIQSSQISEKEITRYAQNYLDYLKKIGEMPAKHVATIPPPFNTHCRKTMNGEVVAHNSAEFINQLSSVREACASWKIDVLEIIPSPSTKSATLYYTIQAHPLGAFTVMKIARFDDSGKVLEINEVYSPVKEEKKNENK